MAILCRWVIYITFMMQHSVAFSRVPGELESSGTQGLALGHGGVADLSHSEAVRVNPAMLAIGQEYVFDFSYHAPHQGRNYAQGGIKDSKTRAVAAGLHFTYPNENRKTFSETQSFTSRKVGVGIAKGSKDFAIGAAAHSILGISNDNSGEVAAYTYGFGLYKQLSGALAFGASLQNLGNDKVKVLAPKERRLGFSFRPRSSGFKHISLEYKMRQKLEYFESTLSPGRRFLYNVSRASDIGFEKMAILSSSYSQGGFVAMGALGRELGGSRKSYSLGAGFDYENLNFSYVVSRPFANESQHIHEAIGLKIKIDM